MNLDYVTQLFKLLKDDKMLDSFIKYLFDFDDNETYTFLSLKILPYDEGKTLQLAVSNNEDVTKLSFSEYKVRYVEENSQFIRPEWRDYPDRYLKFMSKHFPNYADDCVQDRILEFEKNKQKEINRLKKLFSNSQENKTNL